MQCQKHVINMIVVFSGLIGLNNYIIIKSDIDYKSEKNIHPMCTVINNRI